jgi:hypothetical protein
MASRNKKTTMAKLTRESRLRERRIDKQARKEARKNAPAIDALAPDDDLIPEHDEDSTPDPSGVRPNRPASV